LEDIFYKICLDKSEIKFNTPQNEKTSLNTNEPPLFRLNSEIKTRKSIYKSNEISTPATTTIKEQKKTFLSKVIRISQQLVPSSSRLKATFIKDLNKNKRNLKYIILMLLIPVIQVTIFNLCIGPPPRNIPIGIVNYDDIDGFGSHFIQQLDNKTLNKINYKSYEEAYNVLREGKIMCLIRIDHNFSIELMQVVMKQKLLSHGFTKIINIQMDNTSIILRMPKPGVIYY
jgi:hypothetical protein